MAFSFDPALPSAKDRVRLVLGDTFAPGLRQDETINVMITSSGELAATAQLAEGLAAEFAQRPDSVSSDDGAITWRERVKTWLELAARARAMANAANAALAGGSVSRSAQRGDESYAEYRRPEWWTQ